MAREFIDGFEAGDLKLWDSVSPVAPSIVTGISGMDGTYCLSCITDATWLLKNVTAASEYRLAFRYRLNLAGYTRGLCSFFNGATQLARLQRNSVTGFIEARRGIGSGTLLATGTITVPLNTPVLIEVRYKPADAGGIFQVRVNGVLDIDFSGDTTDGATTIDGIRIGCDTSSNNSAGYFDNIVIDDATWPGDTKIQAIVPTGAGASTQWAPSTGANWQCVDEKPASEADLNSSNTVGHLDTYAAGDLVGSIENVKCLQVQALAVKEGAPTPLNLQLAVKSGATTYLSTDKAVPATTSKGLAALWELDPATAAPWEIAGVADAEIGMKAVA